MSEILLSLPIAVECLTVTGVKPGKVPAFKSCEYELSSHDTEAQISKVHV